LSAFDKKVCLVTGAGSSGIGRAMAVAYGIVILLDPSPAEAFHAAVREAASVCPAGAITLDGRP
jgi:NAD(P)-dependent dehydrogenase (short-subunit alcohol dehydrogenase family)